MTKKRIGLLTGGGDVPPLNAVIAAVQQASLEYSVQGIGFLKGWRGVVEDQSVDLSRIDCNPLVGGTVLKSSRVKLTKIPGGIERAMKNIGRLHLDGLIVIGGEDTLSNCFCLPQVPQVLIAKTIDNDVGLLPQGRRRIQPGEIVNYFTLGFPSAAQKISSFVSLKEGLRTTAYSHERILVVESMGMHSGWLALSSSMGHPDFIVIPEFPLDYGRIKDLIVRKYKKQRNVIIVVAEGARFADGSYISADEKEKDDFGHPRFKGAAEALSKKLKRDLKEYFDTRNVNGVNPSYLYRAGSPAELDLQSALKMGQEAIRLLGYGLAESVFLSLRKEKEGFTAVPYPLAKFKSIAEMHRFVDRRFYNPDQYAVTGEGKGYLSEILPEIPDGNYGLP